MRHGLRDNVVAVLPIRVLYNVPSDKGELFEIIAIIVDHSYILLYCIH